MKNKNKILLLCLSFFICEVKGLEKFGIFRFLLTLIFHDYKTEAQILMTILKVKLNHSMLSLRQKSLALKENTKTKNV